MTPKTEAIMTRVDAISYWGGFVLPRELEKIRKRVSLVGEPQKAMHMTLRYFGHGSKRNPDRLKHLRPEFFGKDFEVVVDGIGTYSVDGVVKNQGLRISRKQMELVRFHDGTTLLDMCANEVPHVTLCVANGGKAVDTAKCDFVDCEPFEVTLRLGAWAGYELY